MLFLLQHCFDHSCLSQVLTQRQQICSFLLALDLVLCLKTLNMLQPFLVLCVIKEARPTAKYPMKTKFMIQSVF